MTRTFTEGFDFYPSTAGTGGMTARNWLFPSSSSNPPVRLISGRFGGQAMEIITRIGGSYAWNNYRTFSDAAASGVGLAGSLGFAYLFPSTATFTYYMFSLGQGGSQCLTFRYTMAGEIEVWRGDLAAFLGVTTGAALSPSTWKYVEIEFFINDSTGYVKVYVEGTLVLSVTGADTKNGSESNIDTVRWVSSGDAPSGAFDDIYLSDSATALGPSRVEVVRPDGDTATKNWTPDSGSTNYTQVDETLTDGDTTYVASGTVGAEDLYNMGPLSSTPALIHTVNAIVCCRKTDAGARKAALSVQSGITNVLGPDINLSSSYQYSSHRMAVNPNGGAAWTGVAVNSLQLGQKVTA